MNEAIKSTEEISDSNAHKLLVSIGWSDDDITAHAAEGWNPKTLLKAFAAGYETSKSLTKLDPWSKRYLQEGHLWGDQPSVVAKYLIQNLEPSSSVLEVGFGYGRDLVALANEGHNILGVEEAAEGLREARTLLNKLDLSEQAHLMDGDYVRAPVLQKNFRAAAMHRVIHLIRPKKLTPLVNRLAGALIDDGIAVISARSPKDFNAEQMTLIKHRNNAEKTPLRAVYKDRPTHLINFFDEERFREIFEQRFHDFNFTEGQEIESLNNTDSTGKPVMSEYLMMVARKKRNDSGTSTDFTPK